MKKGEVVELNGLLFQYEIDTILIIQPGGKVFDEIVIDEPEGFTRINLEEQACWYFMELKNCL